MIEPATADPDVPTVTLAGQAWPIPELVWRDLKKCRRELIELTDKINASAGAGGDAFARMAAVFDGLSNEDFDRLLIGPILAGLQSLHPSLTRAEFETWRTTETERQLAWLTVRRQSGLFVFAEGAPPSGE